MWFKRKMIRIPWTDKNRNKDVLRDYQGQGKTIHIILSRPKKGKTGLCCVNGRNGKEERRGKTRRGNAGMS